MCLIFGTLKQSEAALECTNISTCTHSYVRGVGGGGTTQWSVRVFWNTHAHSILLFYHTHILPHSCKVRHRSSLVVIDSADVGWWNEALREVFSAMSLQHCSSTEKTIAGQNQKQWREQELSSSFSSLNIPDQEAKWELELWGGSRLKFSLVWHVHKQGFKPARGQRCFIWACRACWTLLFFSDSLQN